MPGSIVTLDALLRAIRKASLSPSPTRTVLRCSSTWPRRADCLLATAQSCRQERSLHVWRRTLPRLSSTIRTLASLRGLLDGIQNFLPQFFHSPSVKIANPASSSKSSPADDAAREVFSEEVRALLRHLTSTIVVCTSVHDSQPRAMTMSSFTSLSLSPTPLITFNVRTPSRTLDAIASSRTFNVHLLEQNVYGAALAGQFTKGNVEGIFQGFLDQSRGITGEAPVISAKGILHVLKCNLFEGDKHDGFMRVRDHVIVVGEVVSMIPGVGKERYGLAYADIRYRKIGDVIPR